MMDTQIDATPSVDDIKKQLLSEHYEHPFKWDPMKKMKIIPSPEDVIQSLDIDELVIKSDAELVTETDDDELETETEPAYSWDPEFNYERIINLIRKSYVWTNINEFEEAMESLQRAEEFINDYKNTSTCNQAFLHILMSTKAFILALTENVNGASQIIPNIEKISEMDIENRATLNGLCGIFYGEFSYEGFTETVRFLSKAIELNPHESRWHFLKGKYLSRIRHHEQPRGLPSEEEIYHLEEANKLKKHGSHDLLYLAQAYGETAKYYFQELWKNSATLLPEAQIWEEKKKIFRLNEKASELYNESLKMNPDNLSIILRCAKGFMRLPEPFRQGQMAKKLIDKALKAFPESPFGNHTMVQYYERIENDVHKAVPHLKICAKHKIFPAVMDLVRIEYQYDEYRNEEMDIVQRLEALLDDYTETLLRCQIYALLSSHHVLTLNEVHKACQYANEIKRLKGNYEFLKQHLPLWKSPQFSRSQPINLQELLLDEIKIALLDSGCSNDEKKNLEAFFEDLSSSCDKPVSITEAPQYLKKDIIANAENFKPNNNGRRNFGMNKEFPKVAHENRGRRPLAVQVTPSLSWRKTSKGPKTAIIPPPKGNPEEKSLIDLTSDSSRVEVDTSLDKNKI